MRGIGINGEQIDNFRSILDYTDILNIFSSRSSIELSKQFVGPVTLTGHVCDDLNQRELIAEMSARTK